MGSNKNHDTNRSIQRDARALAKKVGIKYTKALRILNEGSTVKDKDE